MQTNNSSILEAVHALDECIEEINNKNILQVVIVGHFTYFSSQLKLIRKSSNIQILAYSY